ncbi:hypothetical protein HMPREF1583_01411 [Gardnerella vaginalis JCP8151B]|nr:hypothetical protein HMPREF1583_01411 [Gardnerella vaginalis JCP8151B]
MSDILNNESANNQSEENAQYSAQSETPITDKARANANPAPTTIASLKWRVADISLGAALAALFGIIYWGFTIVFFSQISPILRTVLPGFGSILHGVWYMSGPLALLLIRKPGAAIYVNVVGAVFENILGQQFSAFMVLASAALQAVFSELPFAIARYKKYNLTLSVISGTLTALEYGIYLMFVVYQGKSANYLTIHMICELISGFVIAGIVPWLLFVAVRKTGALSNFASGRDQEVVA